MRSDNIVLGSYQEWKSWKNDLNLDYRLFIYYIFFLPLINLFWKYRIPVFQFTIPELATGISLILIGFVLVKDRQKTEGDYFAKYFKYFTLIIVANFCYVIFKNFSISSLDLGLKYLTAIFFYYMFKVIVKSDRDFLMISQTYIASFGFIIFSFFYFSDSAGRLARGLVRYTSGYYDVTNVSVPALYTFILLFFIYSRTKISKEVFLKRSRYQIFLLQALIGYIIFNTYHISSYTILILIIALNIPYVIKIDKGIIFFFILSLILLNPFQYISEIVNVMIKTDIEVIQGNLDTSRALHGRVSIWENVLYEYENMNIIQKLFGFTGSLYSSSASHSDIVRIFMMSGILGLLSYLIILVKVFMKSMFSNDNSIKILGISIVITTFLYSIVTCPTFYSFSCIPLFLVFSYLSLKLK